jgi:ketosteroid isomerase-like protein
MERSDELRDVALAIFEAASRQDPSMIDRRTSSHEGVLMIGTDPNEWPQGGERVAEVSRQEMQESTIKFSPGDVEAFVEGTVGWISSRPVWTLEDGTQVPARLTSVFHQEDGEWKLVQGHVSVGVPNEELFGE